MSIKFDSKEVKQFFNETCKLGGDKKKIDTKRECDKLSAYLAANQDNMSDGDIATFNSYIKANEQEQATQSQQRQNGNVNVNVTGNGNNVQAGESNTMVNGNINIGGNGQLVIGGDNNQQNMGTRTPARAGNSPAAAPAKKPGSNVNVSVTGNGNNVQAGDDNTMVNGNINVGGNGQIIIGGNGNEQNMDNGNIGNTPPANPTQRTRKKSTTPTQRRTNPTKPGGTGNAGGVTDDGALHTDKKDSYKYNVFIDLMPKRNDYRTDAQKLMSYKSSVRQQVSKFAISTRDEILNGLSGCNSLEEIVSFLNSKGVGVSLPV